jgi:integrase
VGIRALLSYEWLANCALDEINSELIGKFKAQRRQEGEKGKAVSTVNASLRVLRRILNKAVEWHNPRKGIFFLDKAPAFDLMDGENKRDYVVPSQDEQKYLMKARTANSLLADVVTILLDTAMRPEECYRLRWESITWSAGLYGVLQVIRGKTNNARRELPMSLRVRGILQAQWEKAGRPSAGWVFPARTKSGHMEPSTIKKSHEKACRESKVRRFLLYDLRHTSLTRLACECKEPWTVARIAGHGDIRIGQQYVHSHRMERSSWWAAWWAYVSEGRKPHSEVDTKFDTREDQDLRDAMQ